MIHYYDILDKKKIGRFNETTGKAEIYENKHWIRDTDNLIMDRLLGVDSSEPSGSPYRFGNTDMLNQIKEIDENDVPKLIIKYY